MTFEQELIKAVVTSAATAILVTICGGIVANWITSKLQARRQAFEIRTGLVERVSQIAQTMFVMCQHTRRLLRDCPGEGEADVAARTDAQAALDAAYLTFSAQCHALETVLGARYGMNWLPPGASFRGAPAPESNSRVFWRWHQIVDLLSLYYFNLKGTFRDDVLQSNSSGYEGKYHAGFDAVTMIKKSEDSDTDPYSTMRKTIRHRYQEALPDLAKAIMQDSLRAG